MTPIFRTSFFPLAIVVMTVTAVPAVEPGACKTALTTARGTVCCATDASREFEVTVRDAGREKWLLVPRARSR